MRAESAFQHYCALCAVFPSPTTRCLHLDPLKLKMATWSAARSHMELHLAQHRALLRQHPEIQSHSCVQNSAWETFQLNGPPRIFRWMKQKPIVHFCTGGSQFMRLLHRSGLRFILYFRIGQIPIIIIFSVILTYCTSTGWFSNSQTGPRWYSLAGWFHPNTTVKSRNGVFFLSLGNVVYDLSRRMQFRCKLPLSQCMPRRGSSLQGERYRRCVDGCTWMWNPTSSMTDSFKTVT